MDRPRNRIRSDCNAFFGSHEEAEIWLEMPAMGLERRCPIDFMQTAEGAKIVEEFLVRLAHGIYT